MTPAQLNKAADSLRPSSILDDGNVESESENEELEQDRDVESESENEELEQDVESESENEEMEQDRDRHLEQEVKGVNEEEVVEGRDDGVKGERQTEPGNTTSDCELVIDYGGQYIIQWSFILICHVMVMCSFR